MRNNSDGRQNLKIIFRNIDFQSSPKTCRSNQSKQSMEKYGSNKHPPYKLAIHRATKSIPAKKPRRKQSSNYYCTWYSRTRWYYQQESTVFIARLQSNWLDRVKVTLKIINLLSKQLAERQINLLRRGLEFIPTPQLNIIELKSDIQKSKVTFTHPIIETNKFLDTTTDFIT